MTKVRVRFAPSPTGPLHIGGVRTALYNYLFARRHGGTMILRIEDTDQNRYVPGAEEYIIESLRWAGIVIDEGVGPGGPHAPYRQSERKHIYRQYAEQLVHAGYAYYAFDTEDELDALRNRLKEAGAEQQQYGITTRMNMRNSLTLPAREVQRLLTENAPHVIRLKIPEGEVIKLHDLIRGEVTVHSEQLDDKVLMKSDGMPTYHLANVVDDYLMEITHVIRGEEWLPSAPLHVLLYRGLGWEERMPQFAHLPLLLKPDGHGKLSKRDGDRMGFPVFPLNWTDPFTGEKSPGFREAGYLPEALINFLALLGWNPGTEQELFSMTELVESFSLERISKSGARFDIQKARWFNQQYLRKLPDAQLARQLAEQLKSEGIEQPEEKLIRIVSLLKERITFTHELLPQSKFFFYAPPVPDDSFIRKKWSGQVQEVLAAYAQALEEEKNFSADNLKHLLETTAQKLGIKAGQVMQPLRVALTGETAGPDLMAIAEILGQKECIRRINFVLQYAKPFVS
ncbi:MAG: glutamate--tRNA ligase [Cyclobacteriaceae bacterium]|nr:glutamate--tRNA ligase [Cyclobacteriaceae bacterium]MDW8331965.1 glutamate--tRNA ligase [Cyclobacteriaceae bacterium]